MFNTIIEICCGSADDVFAAAAGGADRAELNSALPLGGLTPSLAEFRLAKKAGIPLMVMIRPREGGFCYTEGDFAVMLEDARIFAAEGAEGLVFGVLKPDGSIDYERCRALCEAAGSAQKVFHRAFDVVPDWREAMDTLISLGFERILTSGQAASAALGADTLRDMVDYAAGRIEILPGGGIRPHNATGLLAATGCTQLHSSAASPVRDSSCCGNPAVHFGGNVPENEELYSRTDIEKVRALIASTY